ncbi:DUF4124 domain-containing protein [Marinobacter confluentis]|uniref:DUF4124 domain-containing protein n=1 Tax=Marinobacter confluentis TaxID=1697557 RepID=A0A4Z1BGN7_9GAMM|nr:DUF4124 domain-containing protein [Marinobacter confluentis]TGN38536.1 DUF4124 domain-containing protein [Marinobacter confluentis]
MTRKLILVTGITALLSFPVAAEIYRQVDAQGNVTYTDEPSDQAPAETVRIKPVTTVTLPKPEAVREPEQLREKVEKEGAAYSDLRFTAPEDDQAFHSGSGDVAFQVASSPGLKNGHKYEVTLDGQPVGQSTSGTVSVRNIDRGTHRAGVNIVDSSGVTIKTGDTITFTIHRPSVLN